MIRTYWLALQQNGDGTLVDAFSGDRILIATGGAIELRCAVVLDKRTLASLEGAVAATLTMRKDDARGEVLANKTIVAEDFDPDLTFEEWKERSNQHFAFRLTAEETSWKIAARWKGKIHLTISVVNSEAGRSLMRRGECVAIDAGLDTASGSGITGPTYLTRLESMAMFFLRTEPESFEFGTDGSLGLWNATQSRFHKLAITGTEGNEQIVIGAAGANPFRLSPTTGLPQLWNATQGKYHSIQITGATGAEQIIIGEGESL